LYRARGAHLQSPHINPPTPFKHQNLSRATPALASPPTPIVARPLATSSACLPHLLLPPTSPRRSEVQNPTSSFAWSRSYAAKAARGGGGGGGGKKGGSKGKGRGGGGGKQRQGGSDDEEDDADDDDEDGGAADDEEDAYPVKMDEIEG
jgi:hypothetical protein